jgi:hypothetical protein
MQIALLVVYLAQFRFAEDPSLFFGSAIQPVGILLIPIIERMNSSQRKLILNPLTIIRPPVPSKGTRLAVY